MVGPLHVVYDLFPSFSFIDSISYTIACVIYQTSIKNTVFFILTERNKYITSQMKGCSDAYNKNHYL